MPPVEMLEQLSELYGLTINELLCGKKLEQEEFKEVAEENIKAALAASAFEFEGEDRFFQEKVVEREQSSPGAWWNHLARSLDRFEISGRSAGGTGRCRQERIGGCRPGWTIQVVYTIWTVLPGLFCGVGRKASADNLPLPFFLICGTLIVE